MSLQTLVSKYIASTEHVFHELQTVKTSLTINMNDVRKVIESAKAYLEDAKYYKDKKRFAVSLASVSYCEGLLDALKILGVVKFEWPQRKKER
jgi:hypothetical protein